MADLLNEPNPLADSFRYVDTVGPDASPEDISAAMDSDDEVTDAKGNLHVASQRSADAHAKNRATGKVLGVPGNIVGDDPGSFEPQAKSAEATRAILDYRGMRKHIATNPGFAEVGHDELPQLGAIETDMDAVLTTWNKGEELDQKDAIVQADRAANAQAAARYRTKFALDRGDQYAAPKLGQYVDPAQSGIRQGEVMAGSAIIETVNKMMHIPYVIAGGVMGGLGMESGKALEQGAAMAWRESDLRTLQLTPDVSSLGAWAPKAQQYGRTAIEQLPMLAISGGVGLVGKAATASQVAIAARAGAHVGAGAGAALGGTSEYLDLREAGLGRGKAAVGGLINAGLEYGSEFFGLEAATRLMGRSGGAKFLWEVGGKDITSEEGAFVAQAFVSGGLKGESMGDIFAKLPEGMIDTAFSSLATTGMYGSIHAASKLLQTTKVEVETAKDLNSAFATVNASKMLQRDPAELGKYVDSLAQSGVTHVFVDSAELAKAVKDPNTLTPELRKAVEDGLTLGGDVAVPVGVFATQVLPHAPNLAQEMRLSQGGMKAVEAEAYVKQAEEHFTAQMDQTMKEYEAQAPLRQEARDLHENIMSQLKKTSKFDKDTHRAYASMFTNLMVTMAHRSKKSLSEVMAAQNGLSIINRDLENKEIGYNQLKAGVAQTLQDRKDATKAMLIEQQAAGKVAPDAAFRGASLGELRSIAQGGQLVIGKDQEGHAGISAAPVSKEGFPVYGEGVGYIVPKKHQSDSGRMAEVMVDPKAHPEDMQYVVNGQIVDYAQLKELLGKPTDAQKKAKEDLTKLLAELTGDQEMDLDFTQAQSLEEIEAELDKALAGVKEEAKKESNRRGYHLPAVMRNDMGPAVIGLLAQADLSTFIHEVGHFAAETMAHLSNVEGVDPAFKEDFDKMLKWAGAEGKTQAERLAWFTSPQPEADPSGRARSAHLRKVEQTHEKIARGMEKYFAEGKAPAIELEKGFATLRDFIVKSYKTLAQLNVTLTDEVRGVFNRMIATDEQIQRSEDILNLQALFSSAKDAGMTPEEWDAYQSDVNTSQDEATRIMDSSTMRDMAWTRNAKSRALRSIHKDVEEKRKAEVADAKEILGKLPAYQVRDFLQTGNIEAPEGATQEQKRAIVSMGQLKHKLSIPALKAIYGDGPAAPWRYLTTGKNGNVAAEDGVHPDLVAAVFGFQSGDELVKTLLATPPMNEAAEQLADASLIQKYGDIRNPAEMARAAEMAVMNDARTRLAATQLRALSRFTGPAALINKAAKRAAENIIANRTLRTILPGQFEAMVAKSAKAAQEALKAGSVKDAAIHERNKLLAMHSTKLAVKAKDRIERDIRMMRDAVKSKTLPPEYRDQIQALLDRYSLSVTPAGTAEKKASLLEWVAKQREMGVEPNLPEGILNEANRTAFQDMTYAEFTDLSNSVRTIKKLGELKNRLLASKDKRDFAAIIDETIGQIEANSKGKVPERMAGEHGFVAKFKKMARGLRAEHVKFSAMVRRMDAYKEGGPLWERLVRPMNVQADLESEMLSDYTKKLAEVMKPAFEKGMTKKTFVPEVNRTFTFEQLLGIASNMGNSGNIERTLSGEQWTQDQLSAVLSHLTKEDFALVQKTWDLIAEFKPLIAEKQKRLTGVESEWVQPEPFVTPQGDILAGGYMPIAYDPNRSDREREDTDEMVANQMALGLYTRSMTKHGHELARAGEGGRPLRYDFVGVVSSHVNQVIHDLAWHEYLVDANRILNNSKVSDAIRTNYGPEALHEMKRHLRDIAVGNLAAQEGWEQVMNHMKTGVTIAGLGWSATTALMQGLGATQSIERIGAANFARGLGKFVGSASRMQKQAQSVHEKSSFMSNRSETQNRALNELSSRVTGEKQSAVRGTFFWAIVQMQKMVDLPTWQGQYDAMIEAGNDEATAIALADQAVRDSQGSGLLSDRAGIEKGNAGKQLFTAFYSFFSSTYNLAAQSYHQNKDQGAVGVMKMAGSYSLLFLLPATLASMMKMAMQGLGDDDDPEKILKRLAADNLTYLLGTMVGVRELAAALAGPGSYSGPAGTRFIGEAVKLASQAGQGELDRALIKAAVNTGGILFHMPTVQVTRTMEGIIAIAEGKDVSPLAPIAGIPPGMKL